MTDKYNLTENVRTIKPVLDIIFAMIDLSNPKYSGLKDGYDVSTHDLILSYRKKSGNFENFLGLGVKTERFIQTPYQGLVITQYDLGRSKINQLEANKVDLRLSIEGNFPLCSDYVLPFVSNSALNLLRKRTQEIRSGEEVLSKSSALLRKIANELNLSHVHDHFTYQEEGSPYSPEKAAKETNRFYDGS